jgi:hypothetical protein
MKFSNTNAEFHQEGEVIHLRLNCGHWVLTRRNPVQGMMRIGLSLEQVGRLYSTTKTNVEVGSELNQLMFSESVSLENIGQKHVNIGYTYQHEIQFDRSGPLNEIQTHLFSVGGRF